MGYGSPTVPSKSNADRLRDRLERDTVVGTFVKLGVTEVVDIAAGAGFSFVVVDLEHSQLSEGDALRLVRHAAALAFPAVVRVPSPDRGRINRLLEAGAAGIQLSSVRSVGQVRELVAATRYPPHGERSVSLAHAGAGYGAVPLRDAVGGSHPLLVGQIETAETDDPLDAIVSVGLDVAFAGVTDLTVDMGFDRARAEARVKEIEEAARAGRVVFGAFAPTPEALPREARYVALSSDVALLREAAVKAASGAR
jgi:4-hydroxy-2-oxoheptanedioate aldolase